MDNLLTYLRTHKQTAIISAVVLFLIILGLFSQKKITGVVSVDSYNSMAWEKGNYPCYAQPPICQAMSPIGGMQQVAFRSNSLTLPIGVTLEGRGTVVAVKPGSPAARAGIEIGDVINRINGK